MGRGDSGCNLLADELPGTLCGVAGGEGVPISPDYRNMLKLEALLRDCTLGEAVKTRLALGLLYPKPPADLGVALEGLVWFYRCGVALPGDRARGQAGAADAGETPVVDLLEDAELILAAFWAVYGIRLTTIPFLHWWEFCALLEALPEDCLLMRVAGWRGAKLSEVPKAQRGFVAAMKRRYALKGTGGGPGGDGRAGARRDESMAAWADRRYSEAAGMAAGVAAEAGSLG